MKIQEIKRDLADSMVELAKLYQRPEEMLPELMNAFAESVDAQLAAGEVTEAEQTAIVAALDEANLAVRDQLAEIIITLEEEAARLQQRATATEKMARSRKALRNRILYGLLRWLESKGVTRITTEDHAFAVKKNPVRLVIDEAVLPDEWKKDEVKRVPDKMRIELALDAGEQIPGAHLEQTNRLEVK